MQAGYRPSRWLRDKVRQHYGNTCQRCGTLEPPIEVAHIVRWPEGPTDEANLTLLCKSCNTTDRWHRDSHFYQSKQEFDKIASQVLERVLPA